MTMTRVNNQIIRAKYSTSELNKDGINENTQK